MIWLSLKVSEYSGTLPARYTPGPARLPEFDLTSLQMLCRYPSWAKFCILRYGHAGWREREWARLKRGCPGMPAECRAPGPRRSAPPLGGGSAASRNAGEQGDPACDAVTIYPLLLKHRARQDNSVSNDKVAVKKELLHNVALEIEDVETASCTFLC